MPLIRNCPSCGRSNRIPARHLADVGKCGACKAELSAIGEPIEVNEEEFQDYPRKQGAGSDGFLGVLVRTMPHGRASRGANGARSGRARNRAESGHGTLPEARRAIQRAQHSQFRGVFPRSASVPASRSGRRSHHGGLAYTRSMTERRTRKAQTKNSFELRPIGMIRSSLKERSKAPKQG